MRVLFEILLLIIIIFLGSYVYHKLFKKNKKKYGKQR